LSVVFLALGGNLGDRAANLRAACDHLREAGVQIERCSSLYETEPWGVSDQPRFLNAVCRGRTELSPAALLALAKRIERAMGRVETVRYGPRPIDIDILLYDEQTIATPELTIPHPRLAERAFVLVPLAELAPDLRPPGSQQTVRQLLEALGKVEGVRKVGAFEEQNVKRQT
jgi:2-amino-4-hydroxy-6-hydroxymethyldihydropteridine diphosphokinase